MTQPETWAAVFPDPDQVLQSLGITPKMTGVDLCCGEGYFTAPLAKLVGGRLYVLDIDPEILLRARAEVARIGATVRGWICDDPERLAEVLPEMVDFVLMANALHGVSDKEGLAKTVWSALKHDGRFAMINWHPLTSKPSTIRDHPRGPAPATRISPEQLRAVVEPAGFDLSKVVELPPYHYGAIFKKTGLENIVS